MSQSGSDVEMEAKPKTKKNIRKPTPDEVIENEKKMTTKMMIKQTLTELKSRKGTSLFAIKKHLTEKYKMDTEKNNYLIKKALKGGVEDGSIIQVKGTGASGSFKLANVKEKKVKKIKSKDPKKEAAKKTKETETNMKEKMKMTVEKKKKVEKSTSKKVDKETVNDKKGPTEKMKKSKTAVAKGLSTPMKKKTDFMKRKSIGSIIKPPKMKPTRT